MKAIVQDVYGGPEVLRLDDVPTPVPGEGRVRVRVNAAGVNAGDWHLMRGDPFLVRLIFGGLRRPKIRTLGVDVAGVVDAVGPGVAHLKPGDRVVGDLSAHGFGGFAEFVCAAETAFVPLPEGLSFEVAAAIPTSGVTALQAVRKGGAVTSGEAVLVNGAAGGVGSYAVQIAASLGAEVTGVASGGKADLVRSLGAHHVIDYRETDPTRSGATYARVIDAACFRPPRDWVRVIRKGGSYLLVGGESFRPFQMMALGPLWSALGPVRMAFVMQRPTPEDLATVVGMVADGSVRPAVERTYPLEETPAAVAHVESGRAHGKIVVTVAD